jgi:hypothetical protein
MGTGESRFEQAVFATLGPLLVALAASIPLLFLPRPDDREFDFLLHLIALVAFSLVLTWRLAPAADEPWFPDRSLLPRPQRLATNTALIVIITGATALVTLASSAAMQYDPSLQFLQLLSALDIAWVVAGTVLAVRLLWGRTAALIAGWMMSIICILSIAAYLSEVGLDAASGWLVDGTQLLRLVIPFDIVAALITIGLTVLAARRVSTD